MLAQSIRHNITRLTQFSGRETRVQFWPYVGAVILLKITAAFLVTVTEIVMGLFLMQKLAAKNPELSAIQSRTNPYFVSIEGDYTGWVPGLGLLTIMPILTGITVVLLAAAVVRRLHDRGLPGFLGLLPLPFLAVGLYSMPLLFTNFVAVEADFGLFFLMFFNNIIYMVTLVGLIVLLALPGNQAANRFGNAPTV